MPGRILFRVDASQLIGTGHVMRGLTLARLMRERGYVATFVIRAAPGNFADVVASRGFDVIELPASPPEGETGDRPSTVAHAHWLTAGWVRDADETKACLANVSPDLLIVDHYAIDEKWEERVGFPPHRIVLIDDLADRHHRCGALIDTNLGRKAADYAGLIPPTATLAVGPAYALLRPEFARLRPESLNRRAAGQIRSILVAMGGVDAPNATCRILQAMKTAELPAACRVKIVLGPSAPWLADVRKEADDLPWATEVLAGIDDMATIMAASDVAIGAAGVSAWERCCLGLPTLLIIIADNQRAGAAALDAIGAARAVGSVADIGRALPTAIQAIADPLALAAMSRAAASVSDGLGTERVAALLEALA